MKFIDMEYKARAPRAWTRAHATACFQLKPRRLNSQIPNMSVESREEGDAAQHRIRPSNEDPDAYTLETFSPIRNLHSGAEAQRLHVSTLFRAALSSLASSLSGSMYKSGLVY